MRPNLEIRTFPLREVRLAEEDGVPILSGHAAVFNQWSRTIPWGGPRGQFRERIAPGAFEHTLGSGPDVTLLIEHSGLPLARTASQTLRLWPDSEGLAFRSQLDARDPDVQRIRYKVERGDLSHMSFGFWIPPDGEQWSLDGEIDERTLTQVDLDGGDISLVTHPAYPQTDVALRSLTQFLATQEGREKPGQAETRGRSEVLRRRLELEAVI